MRKRSLITLLIGGLLLLAAAPGQANHERVVRFATLPPGPGNPEGIAADANGNIYVATFSFAAPNVIHIFDPDGDLLVTIPLPVGPLFVVPLGLAFDAAGNLYVADFLNGDILKYTPPFTSTSAPAATFNVCDGVVVPPADPDFCGLNAMTFDASGNLYVSDSFGGRIFKVTPGGVVSTFLADPLLATAGFPPFGANGLAFNPSGKDLYIANTGDDTILKLNLKTMTLSVFASGIDGADGIAFDSQGRLWVAANQADQVVALNPTGQVVDSRGSFDGIGPDGAVHGLLFPASIALSQGSIYVTNAALALTPAVGDEPEEGVTTFTVARISLRHGNGP